VKARDIGMALALAVVGCAHEDVSAPKQAAAPLTKPDSVPQPERVVGSTDPVTGEVGAGVEVDRLPPPELPARPWKRMNIDQLDQALQRVSGGIAWAIQPAAGGKAVNQFKVLARTLGKPDYAEMTEEDLTPSSLFQKFLLDVGTHVCTELVKVDWARPESKRTFFVHAGPKATVAANAKDVDANLRHLLLRFHGVTLAPDAPELQKWRFLLQSAAKTGGAPETGWLAVCVGLVNHPQFYLY
jgi:hypothetical protein